MRKRKTRVERLRNQAQPLDYSACALSLNDDKNIHLIYRSLSNFGGKEMFIVGGNNWDRGATNGVDNYLPVKHFNNFNQFFSYVKNETDYSLVAVEQSDKSQSILSFEFPKKPLFIFGNETYGLNDEVLLNVPSVLEIPIFGNHPCINVGVCSGIVFYEASNNLALNKCG
jgi:tRNA G18 (ribose-2'-O)-methylase SpoU